MMMANPESRTPESATPMRQVRLRPASAHLYPTVLPEEWLSAATVATRVLAEAARSGGNASAKRERILPEEHFEFRGGRREVAMRYRARARTRWADHPSARMR